MSMLRPVASRDRDALYAICLMTGDGGDDARALYEDGDLLGHIYAGPYAALAPECCFVVEDGEGVAGYIVGAADTAAFEAALERHWWPQLRARHALPPEGDDSLDARRIRHFHAPPRTPDWLSRSYPAHLHINLLPRLQGAGWGARLIDRLRLALRERGAPALHLVCGAQNARAIRFYRAYGFEELARSDAAVVFGMKV